MPDAASRTLPFVPRALNEREAAIYCGLSATTFREAVAPHVPARRLSPARIGWLRDELDAWLDDLPRVTGAPQDKATSDDIRALAARLAAPQIRPRRRKAAG